MPDKFLTIEYNECALTIPIVMECPVNIANQLLVLTRASDIFFKYQACIYKNGGHFQLINANDPFQ